MITGIATAVLGLGISALIVALTSGSARLSGWTAWAALALAVSSMVAAPLVAIAFLTFSFDAVAAASPEDKAGLLSESAGASVRAIPYLWGAAVPAVLASVVGFVRFGRMRRTLEPRDSSRLPALDLAPGTDPEQRIELRASASARRGE